MYLVHLKKHLNSPGAVANYFSAARTWVAACTGSTKVFDGYHTTLLRKGLRRSMQHTPRPVPALTVPVLRHVVTVLDRLGRSARVIKALVLLAFFTALRQSNLLVSTRSRDQVCHILLAKDVRVNNEHLWITVRSSKTIIEPRQQRTFKLTRADDPLCCPVRAWQRYTEKFKLGPEDPAFITTTGTPLTIRGATKVLRAALVGSAYPDPRRFTLHGLRRGAVHACVNAGSSLQQVKELGQWASEAVKCYLPRKVISAAPATLRACVG